MRFRDLYSSDRPIFSLEFFPPKKESALERTREKIRTLSELKPDFMTVTYGAGGGTRVFTRNLVSFIANETDIPAVAHLTCVGHSSGEIDTILDELRKDGVSKVLALRGDPPPGEEGFTIHPEGFSCARDLTSHIHARGEFSIAVAGYPETHSDARSPEEDILYLKEKEDAGAEVIITQLFFDSEMYFSFCERARAAGITVPLVPGIMPIGNVGQIRRFTGMCGASIPHALQTSLGLLEGDPESVVQFGIDYAIEMSEKLLAGGAPGIHFYTLNKRVQVTPVMKAIKG